ncbi:MAG: group III truncated hemoglobin [Parvibaculum sp.]|uniref:group III truncated hemoglobin n=1 Tax=Parvibaculum sp. TaxID=2024848 RepID=UPI00272FB1DE|nr:group III truncated hemoglobin [Parvibaculum sp.]MDP1627234.1 group III truncated hemoglobin [Parvibaculum sp.]MDP2148940.1 group III truncated hemoglobin [Parvibaculum sp.]
MPGNDKGGNNGTDGNVRWCIDEDAKRRVTDEAEIERLVRAFYVKVRSDAVLGPIFNGIIGEDWEPHLKKMFDFWSSVMLTTGRYKGQPMRAHMKLKQVRPEHFDRWLTLFRETADEICAPEVADLFTEKAARIAESLQLGMFFKPALHDPERKSGCC